MYVGQSLLSRTCSLLQQKTEQCDECAIPVCFLQLNVGWHPREEKEAKQTEQTQNFKDCYNLHRKHKILDLDNVMKTLEFFLSSTLSLSGCEPCHYVWLAAVCELPPHLGPRGKLQVSRAGNAATVGIAASALHVDGAKPSHAGYLVPCDDLATRFCIF